jgi:hypothetical protein
LTTTISGDINPKLVWERTFGGMGDDRAFYTINAEGGYLVVGSSTSQIPNITSAWVLKLNYSGDAVWNRTFFESAGSEFRYAMRLEDGFLLVGNVFRASGDQDGYVVKICDDGTPVWNVTIGGPDLDKLFSAARTNDDGFVLVGLTHSWGAGSSDVWAIKIDGKGNVLWNKTCGGELDDAGRGIVASGDSSFVIAGYTNSVGNGDYDYMLLKIDESGQHVWNRTYGGTESDKAYAITNCDGDYVLAGETHSQGAGDTDAWVIKVDSNGELLWQKTLGGKNFDSAACVTATEDGSCYVVGFTLSFGNGMRDIWCSKIDSVGNVTWSFALGRSGYEEAYGIIASKGNELVLAGWTDFTNQGRYDYYVADLRT